MLNKMPGRLVWRRPLFADPHMETKQRKRQKADASPPAAETKLPEKAERRESKARIYDNPSMSAKDRIRGTASFPICQPGTGLYRLLRRLLCRELHVSGSVNYHPYFIAAM